MGRNVVDIVVTQHGATRSSEVGQKARFNHFVARSLATF